MGWQTTALGQMAQDAALVPRAMPHAQGSPGMAPPAPASAQAVRRITQDRLRLAAVESKPHPALQPEQALTVESECPDRRSPFDGCTTMTASDLEKHGAAVPYRLLEIARLARRTGAELQLEFTARGFTARAVLSPVAQGHNQLT